MDEKWLRRKKRKVLDDLWDRFVQRHKKILAEPLYADEDYIKKGCYEYTEGFYKDMSERLDAIDKELLFREGGAAGSGLEEKLQLDPNPESIAEIDRTFAELAQGESCADYDRSDVDQKSPI